jgi:hypothetical protein
VYKETVVEKVVRKPAAQVADEDRQETHASAAPLDTSHLDEALAEQAAGFAVKEAEYQTQISQLNAALAELQAKLRGLMANLNASGAEGEAVIKTLAAAGLDLEELTKPVRNVFARLYLDAKLRMQRLEKLRERVWHERQEHYRNVLEQEEKFFEALRGLLPAGKQFADAQLPEDASPRTRLARVNPKLSENWQRSKSPTGSRPQSASQLPGPVSGYAVVGLMPPATDHWWMEPASYLHKQNMPDRDQFPDGRPSSRRRSPSVRHNPEKVMDSALDLDPERAWLAPVGSAMPLRPRVLVPLTREDVDRPGTG